MEAISILQKTLLVGLIAIISLTSVLVPAAYAYIPKKTIGNLVYWNKTAGLQTIDANEETFSEISPWAYTLEVDGDVIVDPNGGAAIVDATTRNYLASLNLIVVPSIHNLQNGVWNYNDVVGTVINDSTKRAHHIQSIIDLIDDNGYDGIAIDYENLNSADRNAFTNFIEELADALHAQDYVLAVDVYGKTSEPGDWNGPQAQDYYALGQAADEVRIFLYDYNPGTAGPIAPYGWTNDVLTFAKTKIAAEKIIQGVPLYGYDWAGSNYPSALTWTDATALATTFNATVNFDSTNHAPNFTYTSNSVNHTVWFENHQSLGYKLDLTNYHDIGGVGFWNVGGEDPDTWETVNDKLILVE